MQFLLGLAVVILLYRAMLHKEFWNWETFKRQSKEINKPLVIGGIAFIILAALALLYITVISLCFIPPINRVLNDFAMYITSGWRLIALLIIAAIAVVGCGIGTVLPNNITVIPTDREKENWTSDYFNGHSPHIDSGMTFEEWRKVQDSYATWAYFEHPSGRTSLPFPEWLKKQRKDPFFRFEEKRREWEYRCRHESEWRAKNGIDDTYY